MPDNNLNIAYLIRAEFGVIGGAASYMFPSIVGKHHKVIVLETRAFESESNEPVVFNDTKIPIVNIYDSENKIRIKNAYDCLLEFKPDIIHFFQKANCLTDIQTLRNLPSKPVIIFDFRTPLYAPKNSRIYLKKLLNFFKCQFYIDWVITHSSLTLRTNLPIRFKKFTEIPPGVDLEHFPLNKKVKKCPTKFIYIGSLAKTRRLDLLIDYFSNALDRLDRPLKLDIYGQGDAADDLAKLIAGKKMEKSISLKGVMPQNELFKEMSNYDAGIAYVPDKGVGSMFSKAPSLKSLEYAAAGLPIIASATKGHKDFQRKHGFIFQLFKNERDDFVKVMENINSKGFPATMAPNNLEIVKKFDWNNIVESKLLPLYANLANKRCLYYS